MTVNSGCESVPGIGGRLGAWSDDSAISIRDVSLPRMEVISPKRILPFTCSAGRNEYFFILSFQEKREVST